MIDGLLAVFSFLVGLALIMAAAWKTKETGCPGIHCDRRVLRGVGVLVMTCLASIGMFLVLIHPRLSGAEILALLLAVFLFGFGVAIAGIFFVSARPSSPQAPSQTIRQTQTLLFISDNSETR